LTPSHTPIPVKNKVPGRYPLLSHCQPGQKFLVMSGVCGSGGSAPAGGANAMATTADQPIAPPTWVKLTAMTSEGVAHQRL